MKLLKLAYVFVFLTCLSAHALASDAGKNLHIWAEGSVAYSSAEKEWMNGGWSKTRYGSKDGSGYDAELAEVGLEWTPTFGASLSGHLHVQAGPDQGPAIGVVEAYLRYRILPISGWRLSAKAGRYFPLVSLEHDGPGWSTTRTFTPSAINSWIGEEVLITGVEARAAKKFGDHHIDLRLSGFGYNDTAGTLIAHRGWALHDLKSTSNGGIMLPNDALLFQSIPKQARRTHPFEEVDDELGVFASAKWNYAGELTVLASAYDNRADPVAIENGQYGWRTKFLGLGAKYEFAEGSDVIAQAMTGTTAMGGVWPSTGTRTIDADFNSAFVLASHQIADKHKISGRWDTFDIESSSWSPSSRDEAGWALTAAWRMQASKRTEAGFEAIHYEHDGRNGMNQDQNGTQLRAVMRVSF